MSVIHCHDDKQYLILDQRQYLTNIYANTKDTRLIDHANQTSDVTWCKEFFHVERPFRATDADQQQTKTKKKRKVNSKRDIRSVTSVR
jgi:hypothetical protein